MSGDDLSPPCRVALGDIWGENALLDMTDAVDGSQFSSPTDIAKLSVERAPGVTLVKGGDFSGWDFRDVSFSNICFVEVKLKETNWQDGGYSGIGFIKSDLSGAQMQRAQMPGIMFRNATVSDVDAAGANWSNGYFDGGWFDSKWEGVTLDRADMSGFVMECGITVPDGCPVFFGDDGPVSAKGTNFTNAHYPRADAFDGAVLDNTLIDIGALADFRSADITGKIQIAEGGDAPDISRDEFRTLLADHDNYVARTGGPSFDCKKAVTRVEQEICGEYADELRTKDRQLAVLYREARQRGLNVVDGQKKWLRIRNTCGDQGNDYPRDCLISSYDTQIGALLGMLGETSFLARGEKTLFVNDVLPLSSEMRTSPLFERLTDVFDNTAYSRVVIERTGDGSYAINGMAIGANAHMCHIGASGLTLDTNSGWYVLPAHTAEKPAPIFRIIADKVEVFADGRLDYERYAEVANHMGCGARASFSDMRRLNVSAKKLEKYARDLAEGL
ncbi:hypothetical protein [Sphingorhabdus sp. Alg239-R122]|uniref:hypothetical protein n=1 Tax=Sphingorhabdus sp. Alg239-R122 TaxID=2305989 RepID=UPI0013DCD267|nr:hypothetical protein [Sphingorhabdus sp. Alg239-R122]